MTRPSRTRSSRTHVAVLRELVAFGAVSAATTVLDLGIFTLLLALDLLPVAAANVLAYGAGILASYALNDRVTFRSRRAFKGPDSPGVFVLIGLGGLLLSTAAVASVELLAGETTWLLDLVKLASGGTTWILKFVAVRRFVYRSPDPGTGTGDRSGYRRQEPVETSAVRPTARATSGLASSEAIA